MPLGILPLCGAQGVVCVPVTMSYDVLLEERSLARQLAGKCSKGEGLPRSGSGCFAGRVLLGSFAAMLQVCGMQASAMPGLVLLILGS